ncbi:hypothetical protein LBMAG52_41130 [Planctomycetia bacterium]|nr:hypothetical protein LBMAG52_41130 [Planctomycetia bacterium]
MNSEWCNTGKKPNLPFLTEVEIRLFLERDSNMPPPDTNPTPSYLVFGATGGIQGQRPLSR